MVLDDHWRYSNSLDRIAEIAFPRERRSFQCASNVSVCISRNVSFFDPFIVITYSFYGDEKHV